jgi:hypothetical protein
VLVASSVAYLEAVLATHMSYAKSMAIVAVTVFSAAAVIAWLGREQHAVEFGRIVESESDRARPLALSG